MRNYNKLSGISVISSSKGKVAANIGRIQYQNLGHFSPSSRKLSHANWHSLSVEPFIWYTWGRLSSMVRCHCRWVTFGSLLSLARPLSHCPWPGCLTAFLPQTVIRSLSDLWFGRKRSLWTSDKMDVLVSLGFCSHGGQHGHCGPWRRTLRSSISSLLLSPLKEEEK